MRAPAAALVALSLLMVPAWAGQDGASLPALEQPAPPTPAQAHPPGLPPPVPDSRPALPASIQAALDASGIAPSGLSLRVAGPDGQVRLDYRGAEVREVGSLVKLFTTLAALDTLGPAFRFHTDLLAQPGPRGHWRVSLRGGGDPGLRYQDLQHLLRAAYAAGVRNPDSGVQVDTRRFSNDPGLTSGIRLDAGHVSGTAPWPLLVEQAAVQLSLPGAHAGVPLVDPPFRLQVQTTAQQDAQAAAGGCPPDWEDGLALAATTAPGGTAAPSTQAPAATRARSRARPHPPAIPGLALTGPWPATCPPTTLLRAPLAPPAYLDLALATAGRAAGLGSALHAVAGTAPETAPIMVRQDSRPLAELVRDTNKFSNNLMARMLFLDLAAETGTQPATPEAAAAAVRHWLQSAGLHAPELALENGAGLSHLERTTAEHLEELLKYALTSSVWPEFMASLPIPGQDGTLRTRFRELPGAGRLRLKTGAIDGVRGLAGYVLGPDGRAGTVVCIVNDPNAGQVTALQAAVLEWALRDEGATDASR